MIGYSNVNMNKGDWDQRNSWNYIFSVQWTYIQCDSMGKVNTVGGDIIGHCGKRIFIRTCD